MGLGARAAKRHVAADGVQLWDPRWEPSLVAWADPSYATISGGVVAAARNRKLGAAGARAQFVIDGAGVTPGTIGTHAAFAFDGASRLIMRAPGLLRAGSRWTLAFALGNAPSQGAAIACGASGLGLGSEGIVTSGGDVFAGAGVSVAQLDATGAATSNAASSAGRPSYYVFASDGTDVIARVNGAAAAPVPITDAGFGDLDEIVLGGTTPEQDVAYGGSLYITGALGHALIFADAVAGYALAQLEAMLAASVA